MKLSTRGRYALHCMTTVARQGTEESPVSLEAVAEATELSIAYLQQIAIALRHAGLLRGVAGRSGGYVLTRPADEISVAEIVEAGIGPISVVDCVCEPEYCTKADGCETRLIYMLLNRSITRLLESYTLADLCDPARLAAAVNELDDEPPRRPRGGVETPRIRGRVPPGIASPTA